MKKELISIIINVYNGEKYINKCLDSIINQTYKNLEIIVVNDGSSDNTLNILNSYHDQRIKIITTKNLGLSLSRNVGIDNASGSYLYFVDVDDFIKPDTITYLYNLIKKYHKQIAMATYMNIYNYDYPEQEQAEQIKIINSFDAIKAALYSRGKFGSIWNKLFAKDLFKTIRFEDRIVNDFVVIYKLYIEASEVVYSNQIKYYYLNRPDSISGKRNPKRTLDMYQAALERYEYLNNVFSSFPENDLGLLLLIYNIYYKDYKKVKKEYKKLNMRKVFIKHFSYKMVLKSDLDYDDKIKLMLYRISPIFARLVANIYLLFKKR